ncbi:helix-turn-helix transcriptional regulator [Prevotella sp. E13-27]|uniref:helix-turn-helix transcriptional regulator n=1 Tax=Prevotella sp. E13-27 TaxID=2938122 RepID=UPI00200AC11A|nr:WYL domain-containing protein [Prevotella sp. E13-27]MCK8621362.1 WYL domain-containing protein [Prevotella sp. E13-27]
MRHDKLERELNLLLLLTENHNYTVPEICDRVQISRRNFYYYLDFFRLAGFKVEHSKPYYRVSKDSPFFRKIDEVVHFTEDEAITMRRILDKTGDQSIQVERLRRKLDRLYDLQILDNEEMQEQLAHNVTTLYEAIKRQVAVKLVNYSSPHSNTTSNRIVEPFLLMNGNREVRCFELSSGINKTFKLSRMEDVQLLDVTWEHQNKHHKIFTDIFMFSDEKQWTVTLLMGRLSSSILLEEYPKARKYLTQQDETHWQLELPVCSFIGIGRFVMGLFEDIEVQGCNEFKEFLNNKINNLSKKTL